MVPIWTTSDTPITEKLWNTSIPFLFVYAFSGSILFSCLGWMSSEMLTILADRVKKSTITGSLEKLDWNKKIDCWKYQNFKISQLINNINCVFGPTILVDVMFCFIITINCSFNAMLGFRESMWNRQLFTNLIILFIVFAYFSFIIYVPHRMRGSVI